MSKQYIFTIVVALVIGGGLAAAYQFYFKEQLAQYTADEEYCRQLEERLNQLDQTFSSVKPERVVAVWQNEIRPWAAAVEERANYFPLFEKTKRKEIDNLIEKRKESELPYYYYQDKSFRLVGALYGEAMRRGIQIPNVGLFGAPDPFAVQQLEASAENVEAWLEWIKYGYATVVRLMDAQPLRILEVELWPPRTGADGLLQLRTVGVSWYITLENLAKFLNAIEDNRRFGVVDAIRIQTLDLRYSPNPVLEVSMLFTEGEYVGPALDLASAAAVSTPIAGSLAGPTGETPMHVLGAIGESARLARIASVQQPEEKRGFLRSLWPF